MKQKKTWKKLLNMYPEPKLSKKQIEELERELHCYGYEMNGNCIIQYPRKALKALDYMLKETKNKYPKKLK